MTVPASARRRPPGRYDEPSLLGQRTLAVTLSVLFVALLAAIVFALYDRYGNTDVGFRELGYTVVSDREVDVVFEVRRPDGAQSTCVVRARDEDGAETGRETVEIAPDADGRDLVRVTHRLATEARAVTGEVERCALQASPSPAS